MRQTALRLGTWLLALVVGFVYGVAGVIGQAATVAGIPAGILVALIGVAALLVAVRLLTGERSTTLAAGFGAMIATLLLSGRGPGGSIVVPAAPEGQLSTGVVWTIALPLVAALVVAWPRRGATPPARAASAAGTTN